MTEKSSTRNKRQIEHRQRNMTDRFIRATAAGSHIRAFAVDSTQMAEKARKIHNTTPVMTAALGRLLSAGAMMGSMMKGDADIVTIQIKGDGPAKGLTVTADSKGNVKGLVSNPLVIIPDKAAGKLDVGGAIGNGILSVSMDLGLKEPYNGQVELQTGEIGDDLAYYFTVSDQTPSAVGLGVMVDKDRTVRHSGGFIIQLMPYAPEEVVAGLEEKIAGLESVTAMMEKGMGPDDILKEILGDMSLEILDEKPVRFHCDCSKDRMARALITLGKKELDELIAGGKPIEVKCHFCNSTYDFSVEELSQLRELSIGKK